MIAALWFGAGAIRAIRNTSLVPIGSLSRDHPLRRRFGLLHGLSSLLLLTQVLLAGTAVYGTER